MQDASFLEVLFFFSSCSELFVLKHSIPRQIIFMKNVVNVMFFEHTVVLTCLLVVNVGLQNVAAY